MSVVLAVVLQAFPSRHTRHRGAVRREATTAPKIHARPIFRMALSERNPEPSPQACLSTYGSWPLHLEDHVNCLHRCFTQCRINAGVPESAKSYSGTFLPLLQPTRRIWEAIGAMLGRTPSYPEVFFSVPPTPHTSEVVKSQRWLLSATCLDRDILLGEDLLCWQSVWKGYNE